MIENTNFEKVLDELFDDVGHFDRERHSICLYGVKNTYSNIQSIKKRIDKITTEYRLVILSNSSKLTNINILDIEL